MIRQASTGRYPRAGRALWLLSSILSVCRPTAALVSAASTRRETGVRRLTLCMRAASVCILSSVLLLFSRSVSERPSRNDNTRLLAYRIILDSWKGPWRWSFPALLFRLAGSRLAGGGSTPGLLTWRRQGPWTKGSDMAGMRTQGVRRGGVRGPARAACNFESWRREDELLCG